MASMLFSCIEIHQEMLEELQVMHNSHCTDQPSGHTFESGLVVSPGILMYVTYVSHATLQCSH